MKVHERIRLFRQTNDWTQEYVAEQLGMSSNGYGCIERGETDITLSRLEKMAEIFKVDLVELLGISQNIEFNQSNHNYLHNYLNVINDKLSPEQLQCKYELEKQQLIIEQKDKEINYLKQIIELMKNKEKQC